jgi:SAM-dependent methyltransferase
MLPLIIERELARAERIDQLRTPSGSAARPARAGACDRPRVLELAPKPCFTAYAQKQPWRYVSSDLASQVAMVRADLRSMPVASGSLDVIVAFHILEHIAEDQLAFTEIARMLQPTGFALICVPLVGETTQEGAPADQWERLYGQNDHVRMYGHDIVGRMIAAGLDVEELHAATYFTSAQLKRHALRGDDRIVFLCRAAKSPTTVAT